MPFAYSEFFDLALHWSQGFVARYLKRLPSDYFVTRHRKNGLTLNTVQLADNKLLVCRICGFAIASLKLRDDWILETCSNYGLTDLVDNSGSKSAFFDKWVRQLDQIPTNNAEQDKLLTINIVSFGYKEGPPPESNMLFDMRFLDNPYWVDELRPLTGLDIPVQKYVLEQPLAQQFLSSFLEIVDVVLPAMKERNTEIFTIAFGCTGGQHRSVSFVEHVAKTLEARGHIIKISHREITSEAMPQVELATKEQQS
jgi:P-loop ATPase protein family